MQNNIVYDLMMLESDRILGHRMKEFDLYYKDAYGEFKVLGEAYDSNVEELIASALKKKKMRYVITFVDAIETMNKIKPSANKLLRFFTQIMSYGNVVKGYGFIDINKCIGMNTHFITSGLNELMENDIVRYYINKGRRIYMVNPIFYYKGSMKKIYGVIKKYDEFPKYEEIKSGNTKLKKTLF